MNTIKYNPIGVIYTPYTDISGMPIQPTGAIGIKGTIKINQIYAEGLKDLDAFSHIILLYHLHLVKEYDLITKPFMENVEHGIFSIRGPKRPNPIGFSVVKLNKVEDNILHIENVDILNETPLIDIKPFISDVDCVKADKMGWLDGKSHKMGDKKSDSRFK
ncbi:MAG: tRNA (N6-threonylcarbamoyladenosine(37)-N6)-methyltransferase TrmO [Bacteroidota bacterium]|nr:tRNA (N6-threonylcarbamoyladenosine(37)-N6)-methyltransferase TrmO [Bacteroidota bacterium]